MSKIATRELDWHTKFSIPRKKLKQLDRKIVELADMIKSLPPSVAFALVEKMRQETQAALIKELR